MDPNPIQDIQNIKLEETTSSEEEDLASSGLEDQTGKHKVSSKDRYHESCLKECDHPHHLEKGLMSPTVHKVSKEKVFHPDKYHESCLKDCQHTEENVNVHSWREPSPTVPRKSPVCEHTAARFHEHCIDRSSSPFEGDISHNDLHRVLSPTIHKVPKEKVFHPDKYHESCLKESKCSAIGDNVHVHSWKTPPPTVSRKSRDLEHSTSKFHEHCKDRSSSPFDEDFSDHTKTRKFKFISPTEHRIPKERVLHPDKYHESCLKECDHSHHMEKGLVSPTIHKVPKEKVFHPDKYHESCLKECDHPHHMEKGLVSPTVHKVPKEKVFHPDKYHESCLKECQHTEENVHVHSWKEPSPTVPRKHVERKHCESMYHEHCQHKEAEPEYQGPREKQLFL